MNEIEEFQKYLLGRDKSEKTISGYGADLKQVQKWLGCSLANLTAENVRKYRDYLQTKGAKPNTISRHLASLVAFGQWGSSYGHLFAENPAMYIEPVKVAMLAPRWLDKNQKRRLLTAIEEDVWMAHEKYSRLWLIRERDAVIVKLLLASGLRVGELCDLRLSDVSLSERKGTLLVRNGKGRKQRMVALGSEIRKELAEWLKMRPNATSDYLFIGQKGEPIHPRVVQRLMERYGEMAGLDNIPPHTLRYTFARGLLDSGASPFEEAKLMGNSSLDSTSRYVMPSEEDLQKVVERLDNRCLSAANFILDGSAYSWRIILVHARHDAKEHGIAYIVADHVGRIRSIDCTCFLGHALHDFHDTDYGTDPGICKVDKKAKKLHKSV